MSRKIRKSKPEDAEHFVNIKERLPLGTQSNHSEQGGFLLGTNIETYQFYINHGMCYTALAFALVLIFGVNFQEYETSALREKHVSHACVLALQIVYPCS